MAQSLQETWLPDAESTRMRRRWAGFPDIAQGSEYRPALSKRPMRFEFDHSAVVSLVSILRTTHPKCI